MPLEETRLALLEQSVAEIKEDIKEIKTKLDDKYVTREEFVTLRDDHIYWRNILVSGVLLNIALGILLSFFTN